VSSRHRHILVALALPALGTLVSCSKTPAAGGGGPPPAEVSVVTVAPHSVPVTYEFAAQVVPYRRVEVRPRVDGIIVERPFTEGALVQQGQVLYKIDPVKFEASYRSAQARFDAAKSRMDRLTPLLERHAVAQQDVDNTRAEFEAAQAAVAQTKKDFDETQVKAEIDGRVGRTEMEVGARVTGPANLLTTIDRIDPVYVTFRPS
jgi:membrane fusion protein (multidrug efflux system)